MGSRLNQESEQSQSMLSREVEKKATRKLKVRNHSTASIWVGLGMMGLIGWSVVIPTLLGTAIGIWFDRIFPQGRSWTLAFLIAGLVIGCFNAWIWVSKEDRAMHEEGGDDE